MWPMIAPGLLGGGFGGYTTNAVDFNGSADYLSKAADLTGNADGSRGILSVWFRLDGGNGADMAFMHNTGDKVQVDRNSSNKLSIYFGDAGGTASFRMDSSTSYTSGATWRHLLASWDLNYSAGNKLKHLYVNDVSDLGTVSDSSAAFNADYTRTSWTIGRYTDASLWFFNGCIAEFYFAPNQFLDFSNSANRRKFISATGKPVYPGATGSLPTGTAPLIYLPNPAATVGTNAGTGGNFTINGSPATASSTPSL